MVRRQQQRIQSQLPFIREPLHNLREVVKQLLCLEDHVASADRRCNDCIRKHLLSAEALAEEGAAMDVEGTYIDSLDSIARSLRNIELELFAPNKDRRPDYQRIKQALRAHRKFIVKTYGAKWVRMYKKG
jgi:hypothetical protein